MQGRLWGLLEQIECLQKLKLLKTLHATDLHCIGKQTKVSN